MSLRILARWTAAACLLGGLAAGPALAAPESLLGLSFLDPVAAAAPAPSLLGGLDLSVARDGSESTLRVPLSRDDSRSVARFLPYLSVGSTFPADGDPRSAPGSVYENLRDPARRGMDVGAGVSWRVGERVELFGEYRFLRVNPDPTEAIGGGLLRRDVEGPYLKGGFSIRLP